MATLTAYLAHSWRTPAELAGLSQDELASSLHFTAHDMSGSAGWTEVGSAEITVTLKSHADMVNDTITALREAKRELLAKAEAESTRIEGQIQKLLAITCEVQS